MTDNKEVVSKVNAGRGGVEQGRSAVPANWYHRMLSFVLCNRLEPGSFPKMIRIETINSCNNTCSFCPMNINSDETKHRKVVLMDDSLYKKIIDELVSVNFDGVLKLYHGNEPLLDKRLPDLTRYAKDRLPLLKRIQIDTNGMLLTEELGASLIKAGIDLIYVNDYTNAGGGGSNFRNEPIKEICQSLQRRFPEKRIVYTPRKKNEILNNLGGQSPNNRLHLSRHIKAPCAYPFYVFTITSNGNVGICCADLTFEQPLGNVAEESISSIWSGKEFRGFRRDLLDGKRIKKLCSNCTMYGHFNMRTQTGESVFLYEVLSMPLVTLSRIKGLARRVKSSIAK